MTNQEVANEVSIKIMRTVERRYSNNMVKGLKVLAAVSRLADMINNEFHNSVESLEAIEIMAEIVKEIKYKIMPRGENEPKI